MLTLVVETIKQLNKQPMAIPSVIGGTVETDTGKVIELDSSRGAAWLETIGSFRYEPTGDGKPYTVRKEGKNDEYWYGCRKIEGKVRKKYIGKSSEVSVAKLEEIAEALEIPPEPRAEKVAEVAEVAERVAERVAESRVTALESQVAELLKAVKDIQEALPGKSDVGDTVELPKVDNEVVERLQNELSNLKAENENWRKSDFATIEQLKKGKESLRQELRSKIRQIEGQDAELLKLHERNGDLRLKVQNLNEQLTTERADREEVETQLSDLKQNSAPASELLEKTLPDAATILSQLRGKRKKTPVTLADIEAILEMIEKSCDDTSQED